MSPPLRLVPPRRGQARSFWFRRASPARKIAPPKTGRGGPLNPRGTRECQACWQNRLALPFRVSPGLSGRHSASPSPGPNPNPIQLRLRRNHLPVSLFITCFPANPKPGTRNPEVDASRPSRIAKKCPAGHCSRSSAHRFLAKLQAALRPCPACTPRCGRGCLPALPFLLRHAALRRRESRPRTAIPLRGHAPR